MVPLHEGGGGIGTTVIVIKGDIGKGRCGFHKIQVGHPFPGFKGPAGQLLSGGGQPGDIDRDLVVCGGVKTAPGAPSNLFPVAIGQERGHLVQGGGLRRLGLCHAQGIGAGIGVIGVCCNVIGAAGGGRVDQKGFKAPPASSLEVIWVPLLL